MSCGLSLSDWVAIANLVLAVMALVVARSTIKEAEENWRQQKCFDLYFKAGQALPHVCAMPITLMGHG